ncbi:hypothetical protein [Prolixibacter denitrificans]|nr:hypothetical protein [Prolixibacter denitrificans]PSK81308.1 hypothetical protein CLV93_11092 [Prolixibacter denitrificans]
MDSTIRKNKIIDALKLELRWHPEARLADLYKNFFQDRYGPGHLVEDVDRAYDYLEREVREAKQFDVPDLLPLGYRQQFFRVNLKLLKEDVIPIEVFFPLFLESAQSVNPPEITEWRAEWNDILEIIREITPALNNFAEDEKALEDQLQKENYVGHHSQVYEKLYHPHYRLLDFSRANFLKKRYL